jgi:flagellar biogenesis protein FliO
VSLLLYAAAGTATATTASTAKTVSVTSLFIQLIVALVVIIGLIAVVAKLARGRVGALRRTSAPLAVVGRQSLGKGVQVAIVKAGADLFLLGVTQHQVTRICRFNPDQVPETLESPDDLPPAAAATSSVRWQSVLRQIQDRTVRRN